MQPRPPQGQQANPEWRRDREGWRNTPRTDAQRDGRWQTDREGWRDNRDWRNTRNNGDWRNGRDWQNNRDGRGAGDWRNNGNNRWTGGNYQRWDRTWRNNDRYNWSAWRSRNRSVFSTGSYYAPYRNYSYRRVGIGLSLGSVFYSQNYWLTDPYAYRLPEVYGPYRWVRYYDDVLLVDVYSGQVVDAIYDFFY